MGKQTRSSDLAQEESLPSWNTTPIFMRAWLDALPEYLEKLDANYVSWWTQGYVLDRNGTVCGPTNRHAVALRDESVRVHTFAKPIPHSIVVDANLPRNVNALSEEDKKLYKKHSHLCRRTDRALAKDITDTITVRNERLDWLEKCDNSGLRLIPLLFAKRAEIGPIANNAASGKLARLVEAGPGERSIVAWNSWREEFDMWNKVQSEDAVLEGPILAQKYAAAASRLGPPLDGDIRNEIRTLGYKGNPKKTLEAITDCISEWEANNYQSNAPALAGKPHDPRKTLPPGGGGGGGSGGDDPPTKPCYYCGELHWHRDCEIFKKKMAERKKKKGERRAAKAAAKAEKEAKKAAAAEAAAAAAAKKGGGDDTKGDDSQSEKGANLMAAGDVFISDAFFDGDAKTVSLSGASLAALPGGAQSEAAAVVVEDIDDSASDSSVSSDDSEDPDGDQPEPVRPEPGNDDDDEGASLASSGDEGTESVYLGNFASAKSSASSTSGSVTPVRQPSSDRSPVRANASASSKGSSASRPDRGRSAPATQQSSSDSESPYKGEFAPKPRRRSSRRDAPPSPPPEPVKPPSKPVKTPKSPYSGSFKEADDSESTSSDDDVMPRSVSAKRGSSKRLRQQRAGLRTSRSDASDSSLRHMMGHLLMANVIVILAALLWMDRGTLPPPALERSPLRHAAVALACWGANTFWTSPLLALLLLIASSASLMLWCCSKCLPTPPPPRWLLRQTLHAQAKLGASSYLRKLRRSRKPPDKAGRRRNPKPSPPRGPYRGTSARRPRWRSGGDERLRRRDCPQQSSPRPAQQACRPSARLCSVAHVASLATRIIARPVWWMLLPWFRTRASGGMAFMGRTAAALGRSSAVWNRMLVLCARVASRAAWWTASAPFATRPNRGPSASVGSPGRGRSVWLPLPRLRQRWYLFYLRLSRRMLGRRLRAWDPSCSSRSWAALTSPDRKGPKIPDRGTHVGLRDLGSMLAFVVDSGCVWHVVTDRNVLINTRACFDTMYGADGVDKPCSVIGDLPVVYLNATGERRRVIVRNVRCVPEFTLPMLSVGQLWEDSEVDTIFRNTRSFVLPNKAGGSESSADLYIPFDRCADGLYRWEIAAVGKAYSKLRSIPIAGAQPGGAMAASAIRGANSHSHIGILSAADAGIAMHNRLHLGSSILRRLPGCTHDAPDVLSRCPKISCDACMEANASRLSRAHASGHTGRRKRTTTRPGQLVHADIAGPFVQSAAGGYQYALVFVDDFSRYKWVYFMRKKSEAPDYTRTFIGSFNSLIAKRFGADESFTVAAIHTDNAGEFLSREYADLLDAENVAQSSCPPHVHELNGVAERAIRSIFSMVRSNMVVSHVKPGMWPHLVRHSLDVLNRCTGPSADNIDDDAAAEFATSFQLLTGEKSKVMGILPFGCRAFAVKPRENFSKTRLDARAWVGINLAIMARVL